MPLRVYIETTIPSFYFEARRTMDCVVRRRWTRQWWDCHRLEYTLATSLVVREELESADYPPRKRRDALALISALPLLDIAAPVERVVQDYVENLLMPRQPAADALHLALASYYACDVLLTWNCIHLANPNKFRHIASVNRRLGLPMPAVVTPLQLLGEDV